MWDRVLPISDSSITEARLNGIVFVSVRNSKFAEGHHSSQNSEGEGSHLKLPFLQDKGSWVMRYHKEIHIT